MNSKQRKTLEQIFENPARSDVKWEDILSLFNALGATIKQGAGSRIGVILKGQFGHFHEPHPRKETDKGALKSVRILLERAGIQP